jgi:hypothetical protein
MKELLFLKLLTSFVIKETISTAKSLYRLKSNYVVKFQNPGGGALWVLAGLRISSHLNSETLTHHIYTKTAKSSVFLGPFFFLSIFQKPSSFISIPAKLRYFVSLAVVRFSLFWDYSTPLLVFYQHIWKPLVHQQKTHALYKLFLRLF